MNDTEIIATAMDGIEGDISRALIEGINEHGSDFQLKERFKPGSYGCHEAIDRCDTVIDLIEDRLLSHPSIYLNQELYRKMRIAQQFLTDCYEELFTIHDEA